jgi:hypothetical protein
MQRAWIPYPFVVSAGADCIMQPQLFTIVEHRSQSRIISKPEVLSNYTI